MVPLFFWLLSSGFYKRLSYARKIKFLMSHSFFYIGCWNIFLIHWRMNLKLHPARIRLKWKFASARSFKQTSFRICFSWIFTQHCWHCCLDGPLMPRMLSTYFFEEGEKSNSWTCEQFFSMPWLLMNWTSTHKSFFSIELRWILLLTWNFQIKYLA